ncbi:MAG: serine/threonine protein kinase [Gemmataceae bacterium]|nr:serine/threonine protein kinase [Gemmataceae bacterium]
MTVQTACPPKAAFERLLKLGGSAELNDQLLGHLESCSRCWETIEPLLAGDTLLNGVAGGLPSASPEIIDKLLAIKASEPTGEFAAMCATPLDGSGEQHSHLPAAPSTIGHYQIERLLGRGGMGAVYLATDTRLHRPVALKIMLPKFAASRFAKERFLREARAAARIANDNVITIYEADERDGVPYIAMQYLQGASLEQHLRTGEKFTPEQILRIAEETATGLAAAHAMGLIHRDIKPGNLWLESPGGRVKILDFGLAKPQDTEVDITGHDTMVGTPTFMSPEQARGRNLDGRTDLFSLGVVLYRLGTGQLPFDGSNAMAVLMALGTDEPVPVRDLNPAIPEPLAVLIRDLMAKSPAARPGSAPEVIDRIHAIRSGQPARINPPRNRVSIAAAFAALFAIFACGIIIIIKNKDGLETRIDVPDGASVTVKGTDGMSVTTVAQVADSDWEKSIAKLKGRDRFVAVAARLTVLNPRFQTGALIPHLENGEVVSLEITDASDLPNLSPLRALTALTELRVEGHSRNPGDLSPLRGLKLTSVHANGCPIGDLSPLAGMPLTHAYFWGQNTADLSPLRGMKLVETNVGYSPVKDISVFQGMPLENVCLNHTSVDDLSPLRGAPLRKLAIENTKITDLSPLAGMRLEVLLMKGAPIKDYSLLKTFPLKEISIDDPKRHVELLRGIPTLKTINLKPAEDVLDGTAEQPDHVAAEWVLSIGGNIKVGGQTEVFKSVAQLPKERLTLTAVYLFNNREVNDAGLARLAKLADLRELVLYNTPITDAGVAHLKGLKDLTRLDLGETRVTDAGLDSIKGLRKLTSLALHYTAVSEPWLENLKNFEQLASLSLNGAVNDAGLRGVVPCKSLRDLSLENAPVTDAGLAVLQGMTGLTRINLRNTKVTARGIAEFHAAVPGCKVEHNGGVVEPRKEPRTK